MGCAIEKGGTALLLCFSHLTEQGKIELQQKTILRACRGRRPFYILRPKNEAASFVIIHIFGRF
jgi:hypothetical protein